MVRRLNKNVTSVSEGRWDGVVEWRIETRMADTDRHRDRHRERKHEKRTL